MILETLAKFLPYLSFMVGASLWSKSGRKATDDALIIFIIGAPGAGKGTQSTFLVKHFGLQHLSYGDLMRGLRKSGDPEVSGLKTKPNTGNPSVPDDMGAWLLWREIRNGELEEKGMKVFEVDTNRSSEDVQKDLEKIMEPLIKSISSTQRS
ncbi:Uridylate kinase [Colletotrichum sp. SAR 10_99]|nr:Uridylate kinase [Colletotrichum sp. SAR 10_96]KAJ5013451.1 Uridylate kinase [Colletotrichum sp. SAR 10_99]